VPDRNRKYMLPTVKVVVKIRPGPVSPAQKQAWCTFWRRLAEAVIEAQKVEREGEDSDRFYQAQDRGGTNGK
jgi:hypothetical protein